MKLSKSLLVAGALGAAALLGGCADYPYYGYDNGYPGYGYDHPGYGYYSGYDNRAYRGDRREHESREHEWREHHERERNDDR